MISINRNFPKILAITIVLVVNIVSANAQEKVNTHAGLKGIWVICGDRLPKDFTYRISRQKDREDWVGLTDLNFPKSKEEVQAEVLKVKRLAGFEVAALSETKLNSIWERLNDAVIVNSPAEMENDYPLRQANGTMWFDATADSTVSYKYKVQIIGKKNEVISESVGYESAYPGKKPTTEILPLGIKSVNNTFIGEFAIANKGRMNSCKIFRSYYLRSGFEEIQGELIFFTRDSISVIQFTDKSAVEKVPYTYVIQPIDAAGNTGIFSKELIAFNVADNSIIPSVTNFKTTSVEKEKAIKLSWNLKDSKNVISIDIFKCDKYDGKYIKIASVLPKDTTYLDTYAKPIETYYYTIRLNGVYEKSPTSPRVPGILKASNANVFPPQNLRLVQEKNLVHLTWERTEDDTRAYYVYRSIPKTNQLQQIGPIIITDSVIIAYTDTLPNNAEASKYAYAVADQNTSYAISKTTEPVFAYSKSINSLPIPHSVITRSNLDGTVQIFWANMQKETDDFNGYILYRSAKSLDNTTTEPIKAITSLLDKQVNSYVDNTTKDGMVYYYSVKTVANDEVTMSSPSLEAGITIQPNKVNAIANVRVFPSGTTVSIKWNNPIGDEIKAIKIIRTTDGKEGTEEIANLTADQQAFSDTKVTTGSTYYYQLQVENKLGKKSKLTDVVGVKMY